MSLRSRLFGGGLLIVFGAAMYGAWWITPPVSVLQGPFVEVVRWEPPLGRQVVRVGPSSPNWVKSEEISKHTLYAILVAEDARFYEHGALDWRETFLSFRKNWEEGRIVRGGSTITQQVVRIVFLSQEKSYLRKLREAFGAIALESLLSKDEILGWYLNLVEFGKGTYGIQEAARRHFRTTPDLLTVSESIHLALVLPSPHLWSKGLRNKDLTEFGNRRFQLLLDRMKENGYITPAQWRNVRATGNFGSPLESVVPVSEEISE
jgi:monofunctional biosynthetic peptidoglycan transglycosylase